MQCNKKNKDGTLCKNNKLSCRWHSKKSIKKPLKGRGKLIYNNEKMLKRLQTDIYSLFQYLTLYDNPDLQILINLRNIQFIVNNNNNVIIDIALKNRLQTYIDIFDNVDENKSYTKNYHKTLPPLQEKEDISSIIPKGTLSPKSRTKYYKKLEERFNEDQLRRVVDNFTPSNMSIL
jgi:hypothetical protein